MSSTDPKSPRPLDEIEREADLKRKHAESFNRVVNENLSPEEVALESERLAAIGDGLDAIRAKRTQPALPELPAKVLAMSPRDAAARAAQLRADPRFFSWTPPEKRAEVEALHVEAEALNRRAMEIPADLLDLSWEAAKAKAETLRRSLSTEYFESPAARDEVEREIEWLNRRAAESE